MCPVHTESQKKAGSPLPHFSLLELDGNAPSLPCVFFSLNEICQAIAASQRLRHRGKSGVSVASATAAFDFGFKYKSIWALFLMGKVRPGFGNKGGAAPAN
ncbi:hypothetical protein, partial [Pseudomonas urethralis]|uniref:hypothetical protein n=1 Tax=Pseudomonas urethralis TaxID=2740517 RepID=UPI001CA55AE6